MGDKKLKTKDEIIRAGLKPPLCILGTAPSMKDAPWEDECMEFWGVSTVKNFPGFEKLDRAFEMHPKRYWGQQAFLDQMLEFQGTIYMQDAYPEVPGSVRYPYEEIRERFHIPAMGENLFVTNSITWMILLAIHEGYRDISFYGVHMAHTTEYGYQRASCSWALGIMQGMDAMGDKFNIYIAPESELLKARYEYGYQEPTREMTYVQNRIEGLTLGVQQVSDEAKKLNEQRLKTEGALYEAKIILDHIAGYN